MRSVISRNSVFAKKTATCRGKSHLRPLCLVVVAILFSFTSNAQATWQRIFTNPKFHGFRACYFFNERVGFIAAYLHDGIFKTTDGGQTWTVTHVTPQVSDTTCYVSQILMTDSLNGWLTCEATRHSTAPPYNPGLYQTVDGGQTWIPVNPPEEFSDIYVIGSTIMLSSRDTGKFGTGYVSGDGGANFFPAIPVTNGLDFVDDLHGVATGFISQIWYHTTDGGLTWSGLSKADNIETWSVYALKGTPHFFTAGENENTSVSIVRRSDDYGATWYSYSTLPFRTTGHIAGFGAILYVQVDVHDTSYFPGYKGLYRSSDSGRSWFSIGGPSNENDTRFAVLGCRGEVIYAFDLVGNVWKSIDGGDGSLPQFQFPASTMKVDSIAPCGQQDTMLSIANLGCGTLYITNATAPPMPVLSIIDTATGKAPIFPIPIPYGKSRSLKLVLEASLAGIYQTKVALEISHDGVFERDTVSVTSALKYVNPLQATPSSILYDSISLCQTRDSAFTLQSGCFTVQILSTQLKSGVNFTLDSVYKNDSIPPNSSKVFGISFSPTQIGKDVDSLIVNLLVLGKPVRMSFPVVGIGKPDQPQLVMQDRYGNPMPNVIDFGTITRCQDSVFAFTITEKGCDTLFTRFTWLDSTKTKSPPAAQFKPVNLPNRWISHDTVIDGIEALGIGAVLGSYQGYFRVSDSAKGAKAATVQDIPYRVTVKHGPRLMSLDASPRNFDTIAFCDNTERTIDILNLGCDTIHDSSMTLTDPNFIFVTPLTFPLVIKPNSSLSFTVRYLPIFSGPAKCSLKVVTDADSARIRIIPLLAYAIPTDTIVFKAVATNITVKPGDTSNIIIMPATSFRSKGLNSINMTLEYNGDIMSPFLTNKASSGITGATASVKTEIPVSPNLRQLPIVVSGTNMQLDSTASIVTVQFLIYLSDSISTNFRIVKFQLNDPLFNKCTLGSATDTGTINLNFRCGDSLMYNELRYGSAFSPGDGIAPISGVVHPDPVTGPTTFSIPFHATRAVSVGVEILDWSGAVVYSGAQNAPEVGATEYQVAGLQLASGAYHYRLHPLDGGRVAITGGFVVLK